MLVTWHGITIVSTVSQLESSEVQRLELSRSDLCRAMRDLLEYGTV